jgi:hypothetical protein
VALEDSIAEISGKKISQSFNRDQNLLSATILDDSALPALENE